ncbi:clostripain-related cysteine peptidase [Sphingobacterium sp.]|uniref:clostripain-related cysteine peptidase n=1 Tax=Sphingobacterium sp. TaxID=341027 RepID=UPI002898DEF0|nr:clostripain-related cysteine peptidase [Sphingobacterium sp.]
MNSLFFNSLMKCLLALVFLLNSCKDKESVVIEKNSRVILVYMGANNNLVTDAYNSINAMEEGMIGVDADVYVYATLAGSSPKIYKIVADQSAEIKSTVVKSYGDQDSANPKVMNQILQTLKGYAGDRPQGLILWSHATNWLPNVGVKLMSFNEDRGSRTELRDLQSVIPSGLDFLMFDACSMASVEVLYQLREKSTYTIASPAEVLSTSMPYHLVLKHLVNPDLEQGIKAAAETYFNFYNQLTGLHQSATISVVNNQYLTALATQVHAALSRSPLTAIYRNNLQRLDFDEKSLSAGFDFLDFVNQNIPPSDIEAIEQVISKLVVYKAHTPTFLGKPILKFSGLSCYVPVDLNKWIHPYYNSLAWAKDSGFNSFVLE